MGASGCCTRTGGQTSNSVLATTARCITSITLAQTVLKAKRTGLLTDLGEDDPEDSHREKRVKWKLGEQVGEGTFGNVYQGLNMETGELLAVKRIRVDYLSIDEVQTTIEKLKKEVMLLKELSHPNIVKYIGTEVPEEGTCIDILTEYVSGGSISALLKKYSGLSEAVVRSYAEQILYGLVYLHEHRVIHRDLKGANILLTPEGTIKLSDFGSAGKLGSAQEEYEEDVCFSMIGSPYWMAPEVVLREGHTTKADIWSFGCLLIEMRSGVPPWSDETKETKTVLKLISSGGECHTACPTFPESSQHFRELVLACLKREPTERPEAVELLKFAFFTDA